MRLIRCVSSSMSATASRTSRADTRSPRSDDSDARMIIRGLRTSCAITVDMRPSDDSRSRCAASRWNRATDSVSVLKVEPSSRASSSSHARLCTVTLRVRSPVAATSRMASVTAASGRVIVRATA